MRIGAVAEALAADHCGFDQAYHNELFRTEHWIGAQTEPTTILAAARIGTNMLRTILYATIFSTIATLSGAGDINSNDLIGLVTDTASSQNAELLNLSAGNSTFDDLVRSTKPDPRMLSATLSQGGDLLSKGMGLAQFFCSQHQRFETRKARPSFGSFKPRISESFDPLALN